MMRSSIREFIASEAMAALGVRNEAFGSPAASGFGSPAASG